jgi:hypothetical protein
MLVTGSGSALVMVGAWRGSGCSICGAGSLVEGWPEALTLSMGVDSASLGVCGGVPLLSTPRTMKAPMAMTSSGTRIRAGVFLSLGMNDPEVAPVGGGVSV